MIYPFGALNFWLNKEATISGYVGTNIVEISQYPTNFFETETFSHIWLNVGSHIGVDMRILYTDTYRGFSWILTKLSVSDTSATVDKTRIGAWKGTLGVELLHYDGVYVSLSQEGWRSTNPSLLKSFVLPLNIETSQWPLKLLKNIHVKINVRKYFLTWPLIGGRLYCEPS